MTWHNNYYCIIEINYKREFAAGTSMVERITLKVRLEKLLLTLGMSDFLCARCRDYLFDSPMQCPCGDRVCGPCYDYFIAR